MYVESEDYRSIWDLAHQWAGYDSSKTDHENLPPQVKLNLQRLAAGIVSDQLPAKTKHYAILMNDSVMEGLVFCRHLYRLIKCREGNHKNISYLQSVYVRRAYFLNWCEKEQHPHSDFWVLTQVQANHAVTNRPKDELEDKAVCRALARTYWDIDPNIHPAHMAASKAIRKYANGDQYDEQTIKGWISDLDPLSKDRNKGRPKTISYKIDLETGGLPQ